MVDWVLECVNAHTHTFNCPVDQLQHKRAPLGPSCNNEVKIICMRVKAFCKLQGQ